MSSDNQGPPDNVIFDQLRQLLAFILDIDASAIVGETELQDLPEMSSLTFAVLLVGIQSRFGVTLDPQQAFCATTAGALALLIGAELPALGRNA